MFAEANFEPTILASIYFVPNRTVATERDAANWCRTVSRVLEKPGYTDANPAKTALRRGVAGLL